MKLDLQLVRSQFPAFSEPTLKDWAFFESAGGSYPCRQFIDRLNSFYLKNKVQVNYPYPASMLAGDLMEQSYRAMANHLNVDRSEIHFGPSTTQNVYVLAQAMRPMWKAGDEIIVSCQDHEANSGAWRRLEEFGLNIIDWHVNKESGLLDIEELKILLSDKTRMVAYPHCSNVIGHINPVKEITQLIHEHAALSVVDGVGFAPHGFPDLKDLNADIYLFSLYKTYGPHLGLMYVKDALIHKMHNQSHYFKKGFTQSMITPAGPDHAQIASVMGIFDYFNALYHHHYDDEIDAVSKIHRINALFREHESQLMKPLLEFLNSRNDVRLLGPKDVNDRLPIISILPKNGVANVYAKLVQEKIMLGKGHFYAVRPLIDMNIPIDPGVIRISFLHYTSMSEVDQLIKSLDTAL